MRLTAETRGSITREDLRRMKRTALFAAKAAALFVYLIVLELIVVLIISDAVQNSMVGDNTSIWGGLAEHLLERLQHRQGIRQHVARFTRRRKRVRPGRIQLDPVDAGLRLLPDETADLHGTIDLAPQEPARAARDRQRHAGDEDSRSADEPTRDRRPQMQIDLAPVLLGAGLRLFDDPDLEVALEKVGVQEVGAITSLRFLVVR